MIIFSSPGRSPGRAIVLPPASASALAAASASALAKSLKLKFFMGWARRCQASYPVPVTGLVLLSDRNHYVVTPHLNCLETVQMRGHNICFYAELT